MNRRILALVLILVLAVGYLPPLSLGAESNTPPTQPTGLRTELLEDAYAIDTMDPAFSWIMNDIDYDEVQTAYRLVFAKRLADVQAQNYILDTGWLDSDASTFVKVDGLSGLLEKNELYYWQVQLKDKDGAASPLSEPKAFSTEIEWAATEGIWLNQRAVGDESIEQNWHNYRLSQAIMVKERALGVVFYANGSQNYMWQFNTAENKLYPHYDYTNLYGDAVDLSKHGIYLQANQWINIQIVIRDNVITTHINGKMVDEREGRGYKYGSIGYRTGGSESGLAKDVEVLNLDQTKIIYKEDFSSGVSAYPNCTVSGGVLNIPRSTACNMNLYAGDSYIEQANFIFLRHPFTIADNAKVEKAILSATAFDTESAKQHVFDLFMNGESVGVGPARNQNKTPQGNLQYYNSYDVTEFLQDGANVLASVNYNKSSSRGVLFQMTVYYTDGTKAILMNSARDVTGWSGQDGTLAFGQNETQFNLSGWYYQHAENMDATHYPFGFDTVEYNPMSDGRWRAVTLGEKMDASRKLVPYTAENSRRYLMPAQTVVYRENTNSYVVTLEKEIIGGLQIDMISPKVQQMEVRYGEAMNANGSVKQNGTGHPNYIEYWTLQEGAQSLKTVNMKNFRYVEIFNSPIPITKEMVKGYAIRQPFDDDASSFHSSNPFLNELYEFTKYSIKATNQDLWTDSMARERGAYEGDVIINMAAANTFSNNYAIGRHSHEYLINNQTWPQEYKLFTVELAWEDYLYTGDKNSLEEYYQKIKGKFPGTWNEEFGLVNMQSDVLVDWPTNERDGYHFQPYITSYNAVYAGVCADMAMIARELGYEQDAEFYLNRSERIKASLIEKLYDPEKGAYRDSMAADGTLSTHYAQHATAYALAYGMFDSNLMASKLASFIKEQGGFRTSIYASYFVLNGLYAAGDGDTAMQFMANEDTSNKRTWAHVLRNLNATISTEAWDPSHKSNMTYSHPWGAAPAGAISRGMFGIQPTSAGFESFQIKFQPGGVQNAEIKMPTIRGDIKAAYDLGAGGNDFTAKVSIPANTTGYVFLPVESIAYQNLLVNGEQQQVNFIGGGCVGIILGSGEYNLAISNEKSPYVTVTPKTEIIKAKLGDQINLLDYVTVEAVDEVGKEIPVESIDFSMEFSNNLVSQTTEGRPVVTADNVGNTAFNLDASILIYEGTRVYTGSSLIKIEVYEEYVDPDAEKIVSLRIDTGDLLKVETTVEPKLIATKKNGEEIEIADATFISSDESIAKVNADGTLTLLAEGDFRLSAEAPDIFDKLISDFDMSAFKVDKLLYENDFESGENPFAGTAIHDGRLFVDKSKNAIYSGGIDWTDYMFEFTANVVPGSGNPNTVPGGPAATVHVRAASTSQLYMWQMFNTNYLKKHINVSETGAVISNIANMNPAGEDNRIAIAVEGDRIMTYVNGILVDTATYPEYTKGSIGVRTGSFEQFYLDDIRVSTRKLVIDADLTAIENVEANQIVQVDIRLDQALEAVGDTAQASLIGICRNETEIQYNNVTFISSDESVATVDADGIVTIIGPGSFTLRAETTERFDQLDPDFDYARFAIDPVYTNDFEDGDNPFAGTSIVDGRLFVGANKNAIYTPGTAWDDYVFEFTANAAAGSGPAVNGPAFTVHLRAANTSQLYMWQFFTDTNRLKKHINVSETGAVMTEISNLNAAGKDNHVAIAVEGDRIMTYVNGKLVDTATYTHYSKGSIGVRTGSTEQFYLDNIVVGKRCMVTELGISIADEINKSALEGLIVQADALYEEDYTSETWSDFADALAQAKAVLADEDADQDTVNSAYDHLDAAMQALEKVGGGEEIPVSKIKINASGLFTLSVKKTAQIPVTVEPEDATDPSVKWISTNPNIFTIDADGTITPHKQGTATLTAQSSNGLKSTIIVRITA